MPKLVLLLVLAAVGLAPTTSSAQNRAEPLSALLPEMYRDQIQREFFAFISVAIDLGLLGRLDLDTLEQNMQSRLDVINHLIDLAGNQLSSFPLGSASGGFTWSVDPGSGTFSRSTSFGPVFAERAPTIGRKRLNAGINFQRVTFDHLEGRSLRGGEIVGYFGVPNLLDDVGFFFADALDLRVTTDTVNTFATYGVTDRFDIGVAVPINRVRVDATLTSRVGDTVDGISDLEPIVTSRAGNASGLGDIVVRAKFNLWQGGGGGISQAIDVRLPTGDELDLLGTAGPQVKLSMIASSAMGRLSPHVNFGYTISGTSDSVPLRDAAVIVPPEEINYAGGADFAVSLRTTVAAAVVGRTLRRAGTVEWGPSLFGDRFPQFQRERGKDLHLLLGSVGLKVNPFANLLVTANVLFPLADRGLTDKLTTMVGVDYSF
jgi:hypothetical protein